MKLIDILVQELHKLGGWPDGVNDIEMLDDGSIFFDGDLGPEDFKLPQCSDGWNRFKSSRDYTNSVTREQYEAALAASKQEWDGEGLPPVGVECEMSYAGDEWHKCVIIAKGEEQIIYQTHGCREFSGHRNNYRFRPIRSEADKKRDEAIDTMEATFREAAANGANGQRAVFTAIYDAIKSGKIVID